MYSLGLYEKAMPPYLTWSEKFNEVKNAGFDYLELSIDESDQKLKRLDFLDKEILEISKIGLDYGIPIGSICLSAHRKYPLGGENNKSLDILKKAIRFAKLAGAPIIQLAGYDVYYTKSTQETKEQFLLNLSLGISMAAKEGIILGFETMETPFMDTCEKAMKYVNYIDSPFLGVYPDLGNLTNASLKYDIDIEEDLQKLKGKIVAAHIKETCPGKYREVPFNTGHVNFDVTISKVWELGVRRFVTELWYTGNKDWRIDIQYACSLARRIIEKREL
ncbi:MAG: L-ribulose-5-phosphate 3-epimerase [Sphaerochaetaceae bacterium]|nr:L-ribulose-5-phosphate 3-epimerase [Sphaerochaetaceae bacterium]